MADSEKTRKERERQALMRSEQDRLERRKKEELERRRRNEDHNRHRLQMMAVEKQRGKKKLDEIKVAQDQKELIDELDRKKEEKRTKGFQT